MLDSTDRTDVHDIDVTTSATSAPYVLEMYQAGRGDLLRVAGPTGSIIIDSGTPAQMQQFASLLRQSPCELFVLTHLDEDHFGGVHALLTSGVAVPWPKRIWVNDAERRGAVSALLDGMGLADRPESDGAKSVDTVLGELIDEAEQWQRESEGIAFSLLERQDAEILRSDDRDGSVVIEADAETFGFLSAEAAPDRLWWWRSDVEHLLREIEDSLPKAEQPRRLDRAVRDLRDALRWPNFPGYGRRFRFDDDTVILRSRQGRKGMRILASDPEVLHRLRSEPAALPGPVRAVAHLTENGPQLLKRHRDSLRLIDALRQISHVATAEAGDVLQPFGLSLNLEVVGPDATDLAYLARDWHRIREKGRVHRFQRQTQFAEATLYMALTSRFRADTSVTNRSSIQLIVSTNTGCAVLTGDGRHDTLWRNVQSRRRSVACRVFKAAHHGSSHNIDIRQDRNDVFGHFTPDMVWVSGEGDHHPHRDFLHYIEQQQKLFGFRLAVTNANAHVSRLQGAWPVEVLAGGPIRCVL